MLSWGRYHWRIFQSGRGISLSYLEQLFARLRKNGLVSSVRGPGWWFIVLVPMPIKLQSVKSLQQ